MIDRWGIAFRAALAAILAGLAAAAPAQGPATLIRNVTVVTLDQRGTLPGAALLIENGKISRILKQGEPLPSAAVSIDGTGKYVIPGLVDAHVHIDRPQSLADYLRYGVTTVFSLGTRDEHRAELRALMAAQKAGKVEGAKLYATGPSIGNHRRIENVAGVQPFLDELQRDGLSYVKAYNAIPRDVFDALADGAHARGMGVFGHIPRTFPAAHSLGKIDVVAHMEEFFFALNHATATDSALSKLSPEWEPDTAPAEALLDQLAARGGAIVPKLVASAVFRTWWLDEDLWLGLPDSARLDAETRQGWRDYNHSRRDQVEKRMLREEIKQPFIRKLTYLAQKKGVRLLAGSDAPIPGIYAGRSLHQELRLLVAAGLTIEEALRAATLNAGQVARRHVDRSTCFGAIEPGCEADLVLLDADPLADIRNVGRIHAVVSDGVIHRPSPDGTAAD